MMDANGEKLAPAVRSILDAAHERAGSEERVSVDARSFSDARAAAVAAHERLAADHDVVVGYDGDRPVETAMSGLTRVGNHSVHGFGEIRATPPSRNR